MEKRKPRILMIAPLPPPVHGSAMMTQYIKDSKLINEKFDLDWVNLSTSRKMEEIGKTSVVKLWRFVSSYAGTFWKLLTHRYDCCYLAITCHGIGFLKDAPFVLMCKLFRRKVIIHQHNKGMSADVNRPVYRWLLPLVYRNTKVILLSWRLYPDVEEVVKKEQVLICPNGIPEVEYKPRKFENAVPRLLFLSNLIESKGVFVLLDACKVLKDKGYNFQCDFVGGETKEIDRSRFEAEVKQRGLDEIVIYLGRRYGEEKIDVIRQSDIFAFPSFYGNETFGLVLLEAMQQYRPCVTTDEGGIPDVVINNTTGLISKQRDAQDLAKCLEKLLQDPNLRKIMGQEGYEHFKKNYTLQKYEECISLILTNVKGGVNL
jgi:glycosyltransferase involved in cell wall biosynthesis